MQLFYFFFLFQLFNFFLKGSKNILKGMKKVTLLIKEKKIY